MLKAILSSIGIMLLLLACEKPTAFGPSTYIPPADTVVVTPPADTASSPKTFLALGDSYTIGQSVAVAERFPVQTTALLNNLHLSFNQPEIIAQTGWTTANLLSAINSTPPSKPTYDIVSLLIGVNNQYQHRTQDEYRLQFITLLERAIQYAGNKKNRVFVLSIPDYSVTPFASASNTALIAKQIDSFNMINKSLALQYQVNYLNITEDTRQAAVNPSLIASDGLHPSGAEYAVWAAKLAPMIQMAIR